MNLKSTLLAIFCALILHPIAVAGIIANPSFETAPIGTTGQGILPTGWFQFGGVSPGADTYSNDGSFGLTPASFGNFSGVTAFDGLRWIAGSALNGRTETTVGIIGAEGFGTILLTTLSPGVQYRLEAYLFQSVRPDLDFAGGYHIFLGKSPTDFALIGALAPTTGVNVWEQRSITFSAPNDAAQRQYLLFSPYRFSGAGGSNTYPGLDALSLDVVPSATVPEPSAMIVFVFGFLVIVCSFRTRDWRSKTLLGVSK